jgi:hypothetical protein
VWEFVFVAEGAGLLRCPARQRSSPSRAFPLRFPIAAGQLAALGALRDAERREPNVLPDWIGDQIAGIGPEATRVFGRNAQIAAVPDRTANRSIRHGHLRHDDRPASREAACSTPRLAPR